jgi:hypothetical protein
MAITPTKQFFYNIRSGMSRQQAFDIFRRSTHKRQLAFSSFQKSQRISRIQGPRLRSGEFYSKPQPKIEQRVSKTIDSTIGKYYTIESYKGLLAGRYKQASQIYVGIQDLEQRQKFKTEYLDPIKQQWVEASKLKSYHVIKRTDEGFEIFESPQKKWATLSPVEQFGKAFWVGATQFPETVIHGITSPFTGRTTKEYQQDLIGWETGTWEIARRRDYGGIAREALLSPAMTHVVYPLAGSYALGAGIGAFKATSIGSKTLFTIGKRAVTPGTLVEGGLVGYGTYETGKSFVKDPWGTTGSLAFTMPFAWTGYRAGYTMGYGRTEAFLYGRKTYGVGTPEYIRYRSALKISRRLYDIKSTKMKPLDIAKDVMRMDERSASQFLGFYKKHGGVIGGSGASYTQIYGARQPRDIDYFMQRLFFGTKKKVGLAKRLLPTRTKTGRHLIDIHGKEFYRPGGRYRFELISKPPVKGFIKKDSVLYSSKFMSAGELTARKGITSVLRESKYRWFKDIPDFIIHAKSQIRSAKSSWSPFTRWKGYSAEKYLRTYIDPGKGMISVRPKRVGLFDRVFKPGKKPVRVIEPVGGGIARSYYAYPTGSYPSSYAGYGLYGMIGRLGGYPPTVTRYDYGVPYRTYPTKIVTPPSRPIVPPIYPSFKPPGYIIPPSKPPSKPPYKPPPGYPKPPGYIIPTYITPPFSPPPYVEPPYGPPVPPPVGPPSPPYYEKESKRRKQPGLFVLDVPVLRFRRFESKAGRYRSPFKNI